MNILHHKSWHVRTKQNIERVRRDEAKAAEDEKEIQRKKALAESEARTELLRGKSRKRLRDEGEDDDKQLVLEPGGHINFFQDEEEGIKKSGTNAEHEKEKRDEKEKQEKAIGLLTYLGQSAVESQNEKPWYFKPPEKKRKLEEPEVEKSSQSKREEFDLKHKWSQDPMKMMMKYISTRDKVIERDKSNQSRVKSHHLIPSTKHALQLTTHNEASVSHSTPVKVDVLSNIGEPPVSHGGRNAAGKKERHKGHKKKKKEHKKDKKHKHKKKKKKRHRHDSPESDIGDGARSPDASVKPVMGSGRTMQELRAERMRREQEERIKSEQLMSKLRGDAPKEEEFTPNERDMRYNSQFNPELVRRKKKRTPRDFDLNKL